MPSPQADALVAGYRTAQFTVAEQVAALAVARWVAEAERGDLVAAQSRWIAAMVPIILRYRTQQATNARPFYQALRILETGTRAVFNVPGPLEFDPSALRRSLYFVGPKRVLEDGVAFDDEAILKGIEGSVVRHTLNGGRDVIANAIKADPVAVGYYRQTDGDPCHFCAMLASRGPVYKEDSFDDSDPRFEGDGKAKVHDECACANVPLFSRTAELPEVNRRAEDTWASLTGFDAKGKPIDPQKEFRQRWEGRYDLVV